MPRNAAAGGQSPTRIASIATAVPATCVTQKEFRAFFHEFFADSLRHVNRRLEIYANARIGKRYVSPPDLAWFARPHGFEEKNRMYLDSALALLEKVAAESLAGAGLAPADIDMIVTVSSTGIALPSLDARLMEVMPFRRDVRRLPLFGYGCAGGVLGLARAAECARGLPGCRILFLVVELCSLTFRGADRSMRNLISTALFADGAAGAVLAADSEGPRLAAWGEHTWPDSLDVMGWDIADDGLGVVLSSSIPEIVRTHMRNTTDDFLASAGFALDDIDGFVCHPGGAKVLDALEAAFGFPNGSLEHSRAILCEYGNMSAATVLFILDRTLRSTEAASPRRLLMTSMGPGFSGAFMLLETA